MNNSLRIFPITAIFIITCAFVSCGGGQQKKFSLANSGMAKTIDECLVDLQKKKYENSINCLEAYKSRNPGSETASSADLAIADAYFLKKDYLIAAESYNHFIETYPSSSKVPYAYYKSGLSYYKDAPKSIDRDQTKLDNAIKALGTVVNYYGSSPYAATAEEQYKKALLQRAQNHFYIGRFYYKYQEYLASIPRFETVVTEYTNLGLDEKSFYYLISALKKTNQKDLALKYFDVFKEHFPSSPYVKKIAGMF